jgi:Protein of unknown function (DUF2971)
VIDRKQLEELEKAIEIDFLKAAGRDALGAPPPPEILYHYTTAAGLHGILRDQELWATNVLYMNDSAELTDAVSIFRNVLDRERQGKDETQGLWLVLTLLDTNLGSLPMDYFVTCFCEGDDLLSQWRAYGPQGGYCLGFRSQDLAIRAGALECRLSKVNYDQGQKRRRIESRVEIALSHLRRAAEWLNPDTRADAEVLHWFVHRIVGLFAGMLCEMKNEAFQSENEWRLICIQPSMSLVGVEGITKPITFRIVNGTLVPYIRLNWPSENTIPTLPVAKVRCGPGPNPELSHRAVLDLLTSRRFVGVPVEGSSVPLRV